VRCLRRPRHLRRVMRGICFLAGMLNHRFIF
jgi:hypothetical protein